MAPGVYRLLTASFGPKRFKTGGTEVFRRFELKNGENKPVSFGDDVGPLVFRGRLLDRQGHPHDHVRLILRPTFPWDYDMFKAYVCADYDGQFYFSNLKPGKYSVELKDWVDETLPSIALPPVEITGDTERDLIVDPAPFGKSVRY